MIDPSSSDGRPPTVEVDLSCYLPLFDDPAVSESDKLALLKALWSIILTFAQLGWGVAPAQQAVADRSIRQRACGQLAKHLPGEFAGALPVVESVDQFLMPQLNGESEPTQIGRDS